MNKLFWFVSAAALSALLLASPSRAGAQVSFHVQIGPEPGCPYGYYDYGPYRCAPFGYYGPRWFDHGVFIGAGPWFHGPEGFHGDIDRHYDPRFGYHGGYPHRGEHADWEHHHDWERSFRGNDVREEHRHDHDHDHDQNHDHDGH
jgi:hypothetical protein